jgi:ubiquinone/menaquinone biosynthesis C-methylase UbiE
MPTFTHQSHPHTRATMYGLARHARHYERVAGRLARPLYRRVAADVAAAELPAGSSVLDVGTGPGLLPVMVARRYPQLSVVGIDLSAEMVARATSTVEKELPGDADRVRFEVADVSALPFADQSVDLVVSSISMHHWDDPVAGLREVVRVLRPGGQAWIYDFRPSVRTVAPLITGLDADLQVEDPVPGPWGRLNPIGRLVLRPRVSR